MSIRKETFAEEVTAVRALWAMGGFEASQETVEEAVRSAATLPKKPWATLLEETAQRLAAAPRHRLAR